MNEAWSKLKPKDKFSVKKAQHVSEMDYVVLSMLYQPIIGVGALALINALLVEEKIETAERMQQHSVLLNQLDVGIPDFYMAREKLESVGLLKSFVKKLDNENHFIYIIQPTLEPSVFLHDDILSLLLIEKVGFQKVEELSRFFDYSIPDMTDYVEVTRSFTDVFQSISSRLGGKEEELRKVKAIVTPRNKAPELTITSNQFDWLFFNSLIESLHIDQNQIEVELKRTINLFSQLYGINELEMFDYIKQSVDYVNNRVIEKDFKQSVYKGYHSRKKQEIVENKEENNINRGLSDTEKDQLRQNTLRLTGFSDEEIAVIQSCETIPPLVFLKAIKKQKGGFVSFSESQTIENLKTQSGLPDSVINVIIHYTLVVQGKPSIIQSLVMSIANDWAQKKIFSPEDALKQVQDLQKERAKPKAKRNNYGNQSQRKETLPDWAKEDVVRKETPLSDEETAFFQEQLKQLTNKPKEGDN
ncbi:replication initiation and membrane attachment family protein [Vagococcus hydrophili]|uniref:Uncharacterized protein n=1 Tax=Vagococcus hydrophili TaxID=2714947 RepID=A0A6G8AVM7_9ENTE|nr:DnaD domain protein [Vagococcus hydrophili]QIL49141.1 hypothetical protein G7082_11910 [Vagococcus hydrophili]